MPHSRSRNSMREATPVLPTVSRVEVLPQSVLTRNQQGPANGGSNGSCVIPTYSTNPRDLVKIRDGDLVVRRTSTLELHGTGKRSRRAGWGGDAGNCKRGPERCESKRDTFQHRPKIVAAYSSAGHSRSQAIPPLRLDAGSARSLLMCIMTRREVADPTVVV
jgi:hypothetical protein